MLEQTTLESKEGLDFTAITDEALDAIRRQSKARESAPYDHARYESLRNRLADEMARGFSLMAIANITRSNDYRGPSAAWLDTLNEWAKSSAKLRQPGRWSEEPTLAEKVETALEKWFNELDTERANKPPEPGFVETSIFKNILGGFNMAEEEIEVVEIACPPGSGKTTNAAHCLAQRRKAEGFNCPVWMITLSESNISQKLITLDIIKAMKGNTIAALDSSGYEGKSQYVLDGIIEEMCQNVRGGLLIVDEAQHIGDFNGNARMNSLNIINALRVFCDRGLFGIALLSNGEVYQRAAKGKNSTQLSSRMEHWRVDAGKPTENDVDLIMAAWGVSGKLEREKSITLGTGKGGLRTLTNLYRRARCKYGEITYASMTGAAKG